VASTDTLTRLSPYAERLLDDYIYDQLDDASEKLQDAYARLRGRPTARALEDKRLRNQLKGAATSIRRTALAAAGREPEPKKSRAPRVLLLLVAVTGIAVLVKRRREQAGTDYVDFASSPETSQSGVVEHGGERLPAA
jgi:hypothetical protein